MKSARLLMLAVRARTLFVRPGRRRVPGLFPLAAGFSLHACPQRVHQIDDVASRGLLRTLDLLAGGLLLDDFLERLFILILELLRLEVTSLRFDDVESEVQHVLWDLLVLDVVEIIRLLAHFVRVAQRHTEHSLVPGLQRDDVLARGEDYLAYGDHAL